MNIVFKKDEQFTKCLRYVIKHIHKASSKDLDNLQEALDKERKQEKFCNLRALIDYMIEKKATYQTFMWGALEDDGWKIIRDRNIEWIMKDIVTCDKRNLESNYLTYCEYRGKFWKVEVKCYDGWEIYSIKIVIREVNKEAMFKKLG